MNDIPKFYAVVTSLITEIAKERGEDVEDFKEAISAKIKEGMDADTSTPAALNTRHSAKMEALNNG